jgi:lysozyme family protein
MSTQEILRDVPPGELAGLLREYQEIGAQVQALPQPNGKFTVIATFPDTAHTTPFATADLAQTLAPLAAATSPVLPPVTDSEDYATIAPEYLAWFEACEGKAAHAAAIEARVDRLEKNQPRYQAVGARLGIPWYFIGIVHSLESNFNFGTHLHNGDPLGQRTTRVPAGRPLAGNPPFTWEESAEDAMRMKGLAHQADWSLGRLLYRWEGYNGFGYRMQQLPSPYLWSFSPLYVKGLYVQDHVFDPDQVSAQCGAAVLLKALQQRL